MDKKQKKTILVVTSLVLIGGAVAYLLLRRKKQKEEEAKISSESTQTTESTPVTNTPVNTQTSTPKTSTTSQTGSTKPSTTVPTTVSGFAKGDKLVPRIPLTNAIAYSTQTGKALGRINQATFVKNSTTNNWFFATANIPMGQYQTPTLTAVQLQTKDWTKAQ